MSNIKNEKSFNAALKAISKSGEALASYIHNAGLFAIEQVNEHGNDGFGVRLIEALGRKHDAKRVEKWLCHFGKFGMKQGKLVYRKRHDIQPENLTAILEQAEATPYWELTAQEHHVFKFNAVSMLQSILARYKTAQEKADAGEEVSIEGADLLASVEKLLAEAKAKAGAAVAAQIAATKQGVVA